MLICVSLDFNIIPFVVTLAAQTTISHGQHHEDVPSCIMKEVERLYLSQNIKTAAKLLFLAREDLDGRLKQTYVSIFDPFANSQAEGREIVVKATSIMLKKSNLFVIYFI